MKRFFVWILIFLLGMGSIIAIEKLFSKPNQTTIVEKIIDRKFDKYAIENLSKAKIKPAKISQDIPNNKFTMEFDPGLDGKIKKVSGRITHPADGKKTYPIIVMVRGYVDKEIYKSGVGTQRAADVFAKNGFITFAPDFLGYGESDPESTDIFEARFQTYTTVLALIEGIKEYGKYDSNWNGQIFLWGHSNGGQIALTTLEITGENYPTVLWAPVSKPFPYSILYYTDELSDFGKYIRGQLAKFEAIYDTDLYSIHNYYDRIHAPIELHQGTADEAVPFKWSDDLSKALKEKGGEVDYFKYPGSDHNLRPAWDTVVARNIKFYKKYIIDHAQ